MSSGEDPQDPGRASFIIMLVTKTVAEKRLMSLAATSSRPALPATPRPTNPELPSILKAGQR